MIIANTFKGKTIAVFGLGRTGITAALSLQEGGASVLAWDDHHETRERAAGQGVKLVDLSTYDWDKIDELVLSPGVPHNLPKAHWSAVSAKAAGVPIICDIEIFAREVAQRAPERRPKIIAITGTNGKSTTTALIGHVLSECGRDAQIGGNIGRGVLDLDDMHRSSHYVLELSSYQLERTMSLVPNAALFLNLTPDHIDRHGDLEGYEKAKMRIFDNQGKTEAAIIGVDNSHGKAACTRMIAANGRRVYPISGRRSLGRGVCVIKGKLYNVMDKKCEMIADLADAIGLDGEHNWQNAAAAFSAVRSLGLDAKAIGQALLTFPGLAHRMENVGQVGPAKFVNDSKATNADACAQALKTYDNIYWIAGGVAKEGGIEPLSAHFKNISRAYLIGEAGESFHETLKEKKVPSKVSGDLRMAILCATRDALASKAKNPVVLLSPACASFDQFKNFEIRGDAFRTQVLDIVNLYDREKNKVKNDSPEQGVA